MAKFSVTYAIVTPESAEEGDVDEQGFELTDASLREAIAAVLSTRTNKVDGIECIETSEGGSHFRWITVTNGLEYETGAQESRSLHIPDHVTDSNRCRIAHLLGVRGF